MFTMPETITYALPEQIGNTDLFVGRKKEFDYFLGDWYYYLQNNTAQSQAIVARRKKGKTAFLQRLFNILWSAPESGIIPFYYSIKDMDMTLAEFSKSFFATFASHYLSYMEQNETIAKVPISFESLETAVENRQEIVTRCRLMKDYENLNNWGLNVESGEPNAFRNSCRKRGQNRPNPG